MSIVRLDGGLTQPVMRRLNAVRQVSETAGAAFDKAIRRRVLHAAAGETLISEGERPDRIRIVLSGWLSRYKLLEDGRRQIVIPSRSEESVHSSGVRARVARGSTSGLSQESPSGG